MNHVSYEEWVKYVNNEINDNVREVYDDHLYSCDQCLELYLQAVTELESSLPVLSNADDFTDLVMADVSQVKKKLPEKQAPFYQRTSFHYIVAAAMTLLFMTSGVFQSITKYAGAVETPSIDESPPSMTEEIMNKTFAWIDTFEIKNREANK